MSSSARLYEDMVVVRRIDAEATALQRQGELGLWPPLLGQEAAQIGSGPRPPRGRLRLPSYRENGVAYCRGVKPDGHRPRLARQRLAGWDPYDRQHGHPADHHRRADPARHRLCHGHPERRRRLRSPSPTSATAPPAKATSTRPWSSPRASRRPVVFFCQNNQWAISEPVRLQSQRPARGPRPGLRHPQHAGRRQRCPRRAWPRPAWPWTVPGTAAAPPSSRRSPTGWARTRRRTTPPATATPTSSRTGPPSDPIGRMKSLLERKGLLDRGPRGRRRRAS